MTLSRRTFLKTTAATVAVPVFVPGSALGLAGDLPPSERVTIGHIGLGGRGGHNLRSFMRVWKRGQVQFTGTIRRVLRTNWTRPPATTIWWRALPISEALPHASDRMLSVNLQTPVVGFLPSSPSSAADVSKRLARSWASSYPAAHPADSRNPTRAKVRCRD
jgi:hypothetical protein